ncbi:hypothetical protein [Tengunoibacter tsumagoiensis]|nr:hypothetical protein [Tengunoibacter tsumagoiensis]
MKRSLLARLRLNGAGYLLSAFLFIICIPLYQILVLAPTGFSDALNAAGNGQFTGYLSWLHTHNLLFIGYRLLLLIAFALLFSLPFSLFRIIVAQELLGQQERAAELENAETAESTESTETAPEEELSQAEDLPEDAWRGKGFIVLAAWSGMIGLGLYLLVTLISTIYFVSLGTGYTQGSTQPSAIATFASLFAILSNTVAIGLIALSTFFFGVMIVRARDLWPKMWTAFGYLALVVTALLSGSAVAIASAPVTGQSLLTTPATLLFAAWTLWLGSMLVRLQPEA